MKNRERLLRTNKYDLLLRIQSNLNKSEDPSLCVLDMISGHRVECKPPCKNCIQEWLNEEEFGGLKVWK